VDYLPAAYALRREVQAHFAQHFERYGYQGIELPVVEEVNLQLLKSGQAVRRWLYLFQDRAGRELCLRPELTASVVRSILPQLAHWALPLRFHYQGAIFRQNQEPTQMTQVGVELLGAQGAWAEAECIQMAYTGLTGLGIQGLDVVLSHMGIVIQMAHRWIPDPRYQDYVIESYSNLGREIPTVADLRVRLEDLGLLQRENELSTNQRELAELLATLGPDQSRVLLTGLLETVQIPTDGSRDMEEIVQRLVAKLDRETHQAGVQRFITAIQDLAQLQGPALVILGKLEDFLHKYALDLDTLDHLRELLAYLAASGIPPEAVMLDFGFGRTLHYYSGLIFELRHQGQILCGGGRYDSLVRSVSEAVTEDFPMVGFSYTLEAITPYVDPTQQEPRPRYAIFAHTAADYGMAVALAAELRRADLVVQVQVGSPAVVLAGMILIRDQEAVYYSQPDASEVTLTAATVVSTLLGKSL
jgi:histidyl-tRNA synthetase